MCSLLNWRSYTKLYNYYNKMKLGRKKIEKSEKKVFEVDMKEGKRGREGGGYRTNFKLK